MEKPDEQSEVSVLRKRVKSLEKALAEAHLDWKLAEAYTRLACRTAGIEDVENFKKARWEAVRDLVDRGAQRAGLSLRRLCVRSGMSRQNYYARRHQRHRRQIDAELVVALVQVERRRPPRLGGRHWRPPACAWGGIDFLRCCGRRGCWWNGSGAGRKRPIVGIVCRCFGTW